MSSNIPQKAPPQAPRLKGGDLPMSDSIAGTPVAGGTPAGTGSRTPLVHTNNPEYANLTATQLYELNSGLLQDAVPKRDLIGAIEPMSVLREEYERGSPAFVKQIDYLSSKGFTGVRRSRGDGNCFYRSLAFAYVERLLRARDAEIAVVTALSTLDTTLPMLESAGFQKLVYEDFYEALVELIRGVITPSANGKTMTERMLLDAFQSAEVSNSIVVFLRLVTSAQLRADEETYTPLLFHPETGDPLDMRRFCENFVEAVDREADHVQITALARALRVNVSVAYLDGHAPDGRVDFVDFANAPGEPPLVLLYRPGHYDILNRA